ncbi:MAG: prepilin-type N-terminal cleavage/methylation domain-containing protein [Candidatus Hydrogenedentota bacterium]
MSARCCETRGGFTLIELLLAMTILTVIMGIVYGSFSTVMQATEDVRVAAEELRLREFLTRALERNLQQCYPDWRPGAAALEPNQFENVDGVDEVQRDRESVTVAEDEIVVRYWLQGKDADGTGGPADSITFSSSAPLMGHTALPGIFKQVTIEVQSEGEADGADAFAASEEAVVRNTLVLTETPVIEGVTENSGDATNEINGFKAAEDMADEVEFGSPGWRVPMQSMNIQYFDGEEWVDEWDSLSTLRLPWSVWFKINFARPAEEREGESYAGIDLLEDPDFELVVTLPGGAGINTEPPTYDGDPNDPNREQTQKKGQTQTTKVGGGLR